MFQLTWNKPALWRHEGPDRPPPPPEGAAVSMAAALVWEEHCVECAVPDCYQVCPLFDRRSDGKCARFAYGIVPNRGFEGPAGFGADIRFRRWGKLEAYWPGRPALFPLNRLRWMSRLLDGLERLEAMARNRLLPGALAHNLGERLRKVRKRLIRGRFARPDRGAGKANGEADRFVIQFFSPQPGRYRLQLEIDRETEIPKVNPITYRRGLDVKEGWNRYRIPVSELPEHPGKIRLWPDDDAEIRLVFTHLDWVRFAGDEEQAEKPTANHPAAKVKCVAWDLDGTLWDGVIGEVGADGVTPRPEALALVKSLDERGILQTIASKNDFDKAWPKIEDLGLDEVFLYPAIHWGAKSASLREQAGELNINIDTFAFIDDSPFERAEVGAALPRVRVFDAAEVSALLSRPEFDVPVTEVSRSRRASYLAEARRRAVGAGWRDDMDGFLRSCNMVMRIAPPGPDHGPRCLELLQRSNQFNLSGRRYSREQFETLLADPAFECLAFDLRDDFGDYGIVGFAAIENTSRGPVLMDFVMSCRVARKRVEETFLRWYADRAGRHGARSFAVRMKRTERNRPLRDALIAACLSAEPMTERDDILSFAVDISGEASVPDVIAIEAAPSGPEGSEPAGRSPQDKELTSMDL
ncbi:MAG: HAD-IIIC family phosphatase [Rhodospirillales bacterium]|nr:HAD-IIIC family phosphatase [Rhodospirillales bacterium]